MKPSSKIKFDTIEVCKRIKVTQDTKQRKRLVQVVATENLGLVTHTIQKYFRQMATHLRKKGRYDELVSEGTIGLMRAIEMFDPEREVRFSTYAVPWIRQSVRKYLNSRALNIPAGDAAANLVWRYRKIHGNKPISEIKVEEIMANEFIQKGLNEKTVKQYLEQLNFRICNIDNAASKVSAKEDQQVDISNEEIDVKNSLSGIWRGMSAKQRNSLLGFCEAAGKHTEGFEEFEMLVTALCKTNGSSKRPKELVSKGFCEALVETVSKYSEASPG